MFPFQQFIGAYGDTRLFQIMASNYQHGTFKNWRRRGYLYFVICNENMYELELTNVNNNYVHAIGTNKKFV